MKIICPDCRKEFFASLKILEMLAESFKRNPELKFICVACGDKIIQKYRAAA